MLKRSGENDSVSDKAYGRIRTDIIFGKLAPGEKLKLDGLREDYGASVSTLRELLNRLASEGLVVAEGQRGFEVARSRPRICARSRRCACCSKSMRSRSRSAPATWTGRGASSRRITSSRAIEKRLLEGDRADPKPGSATTGNSITR